jgi:uncharacterized protein (TIGR02596 family)
MTRRLPFAGFSLLELLLAMALVAALVAATLAAYASITQATALTAGAQELSDLLTEARDDAVAKNTTVEVRLYDVPGQGATTADYRVAQLYWINSDGTTPAIGAPLFLPTAIVIDSTAAHSTLIANNIEAPTPDSADSRINAQTRVFHFLADGSTDLPATQSWFLTLRSTNQSDPAKFPGNWACLTLDPTTGRVQVFRP